MSFSKKNLGMLAAGALLAALFVLLPCAAASAAPVDGLTSFTAGKPTTASSWWNNPDNYQPYKAVDGVDSEDDRWASQWNEYWIEVTLNGRQTFDTARLREFQDNNGPRVGTYEIVYWDDAANIWKSAYKGSGPLQGGSSAGTNMTTVTFPPVTSGLVRLRMWSVNDTVSTYEPSIWNFDLFNGSTTGPNLTLNRSATASATWGGLSSGYDPGKAVDGSNSTRWAGTWNDQHSNYTAWLEVNLLAPTTFNTAVISAYRNQVVGYNLQYWDDVSSAWKSAATGGAIGSQTFIHFATVTSGKVRLYVTGPSVTDNSRNPSVQLFDLYYLDNVPVAWTGISADGADGTADTKYITLTFDSDPAGLSVNDITVTGAAAADLQGSGNTRQLAISNIQVNNGQNITVSIKSPAPFVITPDTMTVAVWKDLSKNISTDAGYEITVSHEPTVGLFNPAFNIKSANGSDNVKLIVAAYDSDGRLADINTASSGAIAAGQTVTLQASINKNNVNTYKFFIWNNAYTPLTALHGFPLYPAVPNHNPIIEAQSYSRGLSSVGPGVAPNTLAADFTSLGGGFRAGDYLVFKNVDFKDGGDNTLMILISALNADSNKNIDICVDNPNNKIGTVNVVPNSEPMDDSVNVFREYYAPISSVSGVHDVYLAFPAAANLNIDWFTVSPYNGAETAAQKDARFAWWRNDVFGMFIHFGAYAYFGQGEWYMNNAQIPRDVYDVGAKAFNPTDYDPAQIVSLAKAAGQKYIIFTSRHHEGFSMFDTQIRNFKDFCVMSYGNYAGPDPVAALAAECHKQGVSFGTYYTIFEWHDDAMTSYGNTMQAGRKEEYKTRLKGQLRELVAKYDTDVLWFDGQWPGWWTEADGQELYTYLRTLKPSIIINNRCFKGNWGEPDYGTPEQTISTGGGANQYWESCMTLNDNWGYNASDNNWKTPDTVINNLLLCASQGGNYLLNIGPDALGRVPLPSQQILTAAGQYVHQYADAIYGTTAGVYQNLPNILCTGKGNIQYLHVLDTTGTAYIVLSKLNLPIQSAHLFGQTAQIPVIEAADKEILDLTGLTLDKRAVIELDFPGAPSPVTDAAVNIALGKPASAYTSSTNYGGYEAAKAFDGDEGTRWASQGETTPWLQVDLGSPQAFNQARLDEYAPRVNSFQILYKLNASDSWSVAYTGTTIGTATKTFNFPAVTGRYVRLNVLSSTTEPTIWEFGLYNETGPRISITSPGDGAANLTLPVTITGFANGLSAGDYVQLIINGAPVTATTDGNGNWNYQVTSAPAATLSVLAEIKSGAGAILDAAAAVYGLKS